VFGLIDPMEIGFPSPGTEGSARLGTDLNLF
jgi:hypothetical protein